MIITQLKCTVSSNNITDFGLKNIAPVMKLLPLNALI